MAEKGLAKLSTKALANVANEETLALLQEAYPVEQNANRIILPRLGMLSKDKTEEVGTGRNKKINVLEAAGEFFMEKETEEVDETTGKKAWSHEILGDAIEGIILFHRKQLSMWDNDTEEFTQSPVYDNENDIIPLWCNKTEVARGTPAELKAKYQFTAEDGKVRSKLRDTRVLYVEYEGEVYQMTVRGSSMFAFFTYSRSVLPNSVITKFSSEPKEKGAIEWNQMTFTPVRKLTQKEAEGVVQKCSEIKQAVTLERAQFNNSVINVEVVEQRKKAEDDFNRM